MCSVLICNGSSADVGRCSQRRLVCFCMWRLRVISRCDCQLLIVVNHTEQDLSVRFGPLVVVCFGVSDFAWKMARGSLGKCIQQAGAVQVGLLSECDISGAFSFTFIAMQRILLEKDSFLFFEMVSWPGLGSVDGSLTV